MSEINNPIVFPFDKDNPDQLIENIIKCNGKITKKKILSNITFKYILNYFSYEYDSNGYYEHCKANTCVLEKKYVSESYLENFYQYYTTSFKDVSKFTSRIHFFHSKFTKDDFLVNAIVNNTNNEFGNEIWSGYLGYITIRPLGSNPFGTFLFKTYPFIDGVRNRYMNSVIKNFRFDVYGKQVRLDTLAFQQQDKTVGECATFAIWSAFHKLQQLYKINLPSPYEITREAGISNVSLFSRFPTSSGFDETQVFLSLESVGLRGEMYDFRNLDAINTQNYLRELIYAYNKCGIPILFGYKLGANYHLVTIVGYRLSTKNRKFNSSRQNLRKKEKIKLKSQEIIRFYTHNDAFGPFSKVDFESDNQNCIIRTYQLNDYTYKEIGKKFLPSIATHIWVPLKKEIKINYFSVYKAAEQFGNILNAIIGKEEVKNSLKLDIYLSLAVDYKQQYEAIIPTDKWERKMKKKIRLTSYPRYIWVASFIDDNDDVSYVDLIYDSSSLPNEKCIFQINCLNKEIYNFLKRQGKHLKNQKIEEDNLGYIDYLKNEEDENDLLRSYYKYL